MKTAWKTTVAGRVARIIAAVLALGVFGVQPVWAHGAAALRAKYESLQPQFAGSAFKRPIVLESSDATKDPSGRVYAVVEHPFRSVSAALQRGEHWCDMMMLQTNVKRCIASTQGSDSKLRVAVGRKSEQPVEDAFKVDVDYKIRAADPDYLNLQMTVAQGPLGTRDYRLALEAVPLDARHTFVHMSYSYANGALARLATDAYLATAGRNKVGFSVVGRDDAGQPIYVGGMRGVAERTTMRYFLAIEAFLDALAVPPEQQAEKRLREWFAATERYARQLRDMEYDDYIAMKRREMRQQVAANKTAPAY
jgi:hypothetical protein